MKWEKVSLESISTRIGDGLHGTPKYDDSGEFYFINGNNLSEGKILIKEDTKRISSIEYDKIKKDLSEKTVLVAINGTLGNVGLYRDEPVALGKSACYINVNDKAEKLFVRYVLENHDFQRYARDFATGSTIKNLGLKAVRNYSFNLPPLPTQRKIAYILSAYDDLIENNLKRIKLLEEAINLNYKALISNEDKDVTIVKLNSFVDIISGYPFKSNYYNEIGKHKIVTIKNVQDGFFVPIVTDRIEDIPDNMNRALFLSTGDVIMSLTGNVGRVCLVHGDDYVLNQRVVKLSAKELIDQSFIYALVRDKQMLEILENLSNGTAQQNLSPIKMGDLPIRYPNSNLREDFNKKVSTMIEMICKLNIQNTKLREARDILLPKLMNGQIEV